MKTLATLHAKELYDVIRFPADTSGEHIPDPDGRGRKPVLTLHTYCGFSFFSFFGSRGFPWGYRSECDRYTCPRCDKILVNLVRNAGDAFYTAYNGRYAPTSADLIEGKDFVDVNRAFESIVKNDPEMIAIIKNWARRKRLAVTTLDMEEVTAANVN